MLLVILYFQVLSGILVSGDRVILYVCFLSIILRKVKCKYILKFKSSIFCILFQHSAAPSFMHLHSSQNYMTWYYILRLYLYRVEAISKFNIVHDKAVFRPFLTILTWKNCVVLSSVQAFIEIEVAASDLFHMFIQSINFYTFHCHMLNNRDICKKGSIKKTENERLALRFI